MTTGTPPQAASVSAGRVGGGEQSVSIGPSFGERAQGGNCGNLRLIAQVYTRAGPRAAFAVVWQYCL